MQLYPYHENNGLLSQKETYTFLRFYAGKYDKQYFGNKRQLDNKKHMKYEHLILYVLQLFILN